MRRQGEEYLLKHRIFIGTLVLPLLWAMQVIMLRLMQGHGWPMRMTLLRITLMGSFFGWVLSDAIVSSISYRREGNWKTARSCLLFGPLVVTSISLYFLLQSLPFVTRSYHPVLLKILPVPAPTLLFIDPRYAWNFPFHCGLFLLSIGLLMRPRR